jgi:hypothetical protein
MRSIIALSILSLILVASSCGLFEADYINYSEEESAREDPTDTCVVSAKAAFTEQIQPAVDSTCGNSGCHLTLGSTPLVPDDSEANRTALIAYTNGVTATLFDKISLNNSSHTGGDVSETLPESNIETWVNAEAECN